jgi:histidyl-tRNA synthetase
VIRAVKGTRDILPPEIPAWRRIEDAARSLFGRYGFRELRVPVFEETELFARGIGAETDIVSKEMYTFEDQGGSSLTLRPEATAGIVRAVIEHNLINVDPVLKVWASGPMFRRERPQKGRFRQFHQLDVEAFGMARPTVDVEVVELAVAYLEACGLSSHEVVLNSVGDPKCRPAYVETLRAQLRENAGRLCADCQRRTETNPLRVLDCKVPEDQVVIDALPAIADHLCGECRDHYAEVRRGLDLLGIRYRTSHRLVRGLDYYVRTTFEVVSGELGAQNSVLGGGRYDGLVRDLGGPDISGIGFALGMERLVMLLPTAPDEPRCEVLIACPRRGGASEAGAAGEAFPGQGLLLWSALQKRGRSALVEHERRSFKATLKLADKLGARLVALRGEDEEARAQWTIRDLRASQQEAVAEAEALDYIERKLSEEARNG